MTKPNSPLPHRLLLPALLLSIVMARAASTSQAADAARPNILIIMADDMGFSDIGCYGSEIDTPNLDKLAAQGVRFRQFYNNAKCEMTRASLVTGQWWHHVGASPTVHYAGPTFGEMLREQGYRTLMSGKWHAGETPFERGFDRYYGLCDGCCNYWNPGHARPGEPEPAKKKVRRWAIDDKEFTPYTPEDKNFYTTDAFTDYAIKYLDEYQHEDKPFILYLAYTAPHYPLQASEAEVNKYRGRYMIGWDKLRDQRLARQKAMGLIAADVQLPAREPENPAWESLSEEQKQAWDLRMATYAAVVDRLDRNIGRVFDKLRAIGKADNTVIFFLSDNGACEDNADRSTVKGAMPWEVTSYITQGRPWANASNTPYRKYKTFDHEGGVHTPMIAAWPGVTKPNTFSDQVGHLIDFAPTFLDLAGAKKPDRLPGISLVRSLRGEVVERPTLYWDFGNSAAIREGDWKLVRHGKTWELYDLAKDSTEIHDLVSADPGRAAAMAARWTQWWGTGKRAADRSGDGKDE
ncbi:MAG: sulfatase-like hydrolase/transferase [Planctomycetes bacterium]|nr:sulfatase-like hydrolase/transferase [Planctomycetota bacterium]